MIDRKECSARLISKESNLKNQESILKNCYSIKQVHGDKVHILSYEQPEILKKTRSGLSGNFYHPHPLIGDGLITTSQRLPLMIRTADCLSVYFFLKIHSPIFVNNRQAYSNWVGLIHAGWRGLQKKIIFLTIQRILQWLKEQEFCELIIAFGPHARSCCYQVGKNFQRIFTDQYLIHRSDGLYLSQLAIAKDQIQRAFTSTLDRSQKKKSCLQFRGSIGNCTMCESDRFYSHRSNPQNQSKGRNLHLIWLD